MSTRSGGPVGAGSGLPQLGEDRTTASAKPTHANSSRHGGDDSSNAVAPMGQCVGGLRARATAGRRARAQRRPARSDATCPTSSGDASRRRPSGLPWRPAEVKTFAVKGVLELPEFLLRLAALGLANQLLRRSDAERRVLRDRLGQLDGRVLGRSRIAHARHETVLEALLSRDRLGGERHLHRDAVGHATGQTQQRTAGREQPHAHFRDAELHALGRHQQVAAQRDLEPARQGEAFDGRDQRLAVRPA